MSIRQDTIEYDARAFKVKPDGVAEDLLKKCLIEVDRQGTLKPWERYVRTKLVDGIRSFSAMTRRWQPKTFLQMQR
ncbi:MAG: hypothetical protein R2744_05665 [Bacteroidales bacterium]